MNYYEEKLERRRERLQERAESKRQESDSRLAQADAAAYAMNGQPILIGHHSEKRHRRDIDKMHNNMRKGLQASTEAKELDRRAASVGSGGVSSDDPDAVIKLRDKLERMEAKRDRLKAVGAAWRKAKKPHSTDAEGWERVRKILGVANVSVYRDGCRGEESFGLNRGPVPSYELTNLGGNIRRVRKRIEQLEHEAERAATLPDTEPVSGDTWRIEEDQYANRLQIFFDSKEASEPYRQRMKSRGFRWAPSVGAWQRQLTDSARYDARWAMDIA